MISDLIRDNGLQYLVDNGELLVLCSQEPTTYAQAFNEDSSSGYRLGSKSTPTITIVDHTPDGRRAQVAAFSDGTIEDNGGSGSGMAWAIIDVTGTALLATGQITGDQAVVEGNTWGFSAAFAAAAFRD
jgi:hypothetical protein